ncbi:hypothetical protein Agub_g4811, partial [Astrephomene gubernaculifera]
GAYGGGGEGSVEEAAEGLMRAAGLQPPGPPEPARPPRAPAPTTTPTLTAAPTTTQRLPGVLPAHPARLLLMQSAAAAGGHGSPAGGHGGSPSPLLRLGRGASLFRAEANEAGVRSVENGLIPAKMVRVRLLHYLIAKLVGLGGFDPDPLSSVDPDPASLPHMPLALGEELLSLASAAERSRMAFAFGAMKGGAGGGAQ